MTNPVQPERQVSFAGLIRWSVRLILSGVVGIPTFMALVTLSGMRNQYADLIAQFTAPALFATLGLGALFVIFSRRGWAIATLLPSALLAFAASPQWYPPGPAPVPGVDPIRVYSANLWFRNSDVEAMAASIRRSDADVVMLIELGDAAAARLDVLTGDYPYRVSSRRFERPSGAVRSVIASRYPLVRLPRQVRLESVGATAMTPLGPVNFVTVHLTRPWPFEESWGQISQTIMLDEFLQPVQGPLVLAGDFNSVSSARIGQQIQNDIGLHPAPGFPGTWPSSLPAPVTISIDQVYASADLAFVSRRIGHPNGSDHRPVVTEITRARP